MRRKNALTLTVVANMTSNYGEGLGNGASVQKVYRNREVYTMRSRESLKNAVMVQSGMYDDLQTTVDGATQKLVNKDLNASNCRALEGGYMSTKPTTVVRNSSFYLTDAISCESFVNETRFHNNLFLAQNQAAAKNINLQEKAGEAGLMPYQYEYDKALKVYSFTVDLDMIGKDENYELEAGYEEATNAEKADRVISLLDAIENLSLTVKGNLDNAEPLFVVGGLSDRKTHFFENVVHVKNQKLVLSKDLKDKVEKGYHVGLLEGGVFQNEQQIKNMLNVNSITKTFVQLREDVKQYFGV